MLFTAFVFIVWDVFFTIKGVWSFNDQYIIGWRIFGLPIEEWLFFIVVPYACTFIYECLICYFPKLKSSSWGWRVLLSISVLLAFGVFLIDKRYTFYTFTLCSLAIFGAYSLRIRVHHFYANAFVLTFLISIIPFFVVNGFLTSMPVVQYNDAENLGVRLYTIPVEDTFYGMLLMLGNVFGMEWMRSSKHRRPVL